MIETLAAALGLDPVVLAGGLAVAVAAVVLPLLVRAQRRRRRQALDARLGPEAAALGIRYHPEGGPPPPAAGGVAPAAGAVVFTGSSRGLAWRAEVELDPPELRNVRRVRRERTRITVAAGALPPGRFVLVMGLAEGTARWEAAPPEGDGLLAGLGRRVMEAAVDLYVGGHFGARHRTLVNVEGARTFPGPEGFWLLANEEAAAQRLLGGTTAGRLAALRGGEAGPWRGRTSFHDFGLLLSPEGLIVGCQEALREPGEVRDLAEWAVGVAEQLRGP